MKKYIALFVAFIFFISCESTKNISQDKNQTSGQSQEASKESTEDIAEFIQDELSPNRTNLPSASIEEPSVQDNDLSSQGINAQENEDRNIQRRGERQDQNLSSTQVQDLEPNQNASSSRSQISRNETNANQQGGARSFPESSALSLENIAGNEQGARSESHGAQTLLRDASQGRPNANQGSVQGSQNQSQVSRPQVQSGSSQSAQSPQEPRSQERLSPTDHGNAQQAQNNSQGNASQNTGLQSRVPSSTRSNQREQNQNRLQRDIPFSGNDAVQNEPGVSFTEGDIFFTEVDTDENQNNLVIPSRSVTLDRNDYLDVVYPGTGWIYLGETDGEKHMVFFGRKLGDVNTSFTLRASKSGTAILHFYKNDVLTGKYIDDYLEVVIRDRISQSNEHITAPSYASLVPPPPTALDENLSSTNDASSSNRNIPNDISPASSYDASTSVNASEKDGVRTAIQTTENVETTTNRNLQQDADKNIPPSSNAMSADDLLEAAKKAYELKQYENSKTLLDLFFQKARTRIDEGLFLQGQVLEARSSVQNIKNALNSYDTLLKNFPESSLWKNAERRSIYLKRMYIDIR